MSDWFRLARAGSKLISCSPRPAAFSFLIHNEKTRADTGFSVSNAGSVKPALRQGTKWAPYDCQLLLRVLLYVTNKKRPTETNTRRP
jgi:hypothetical protein